MNCTSWSLSWYLLVCVVQVASEQSRFSRSGGHPLIINFLNGSRIVNRPLLPRSFAHKQRIIMSINTSTHDNPGLPAILSRLMLLTCCSRYASSLTQQNYTAQQCKPIAHEWVAADSVKVAPQQSKQAPEPTGTYSQSIRCLTIFSVRKSPRL